MKISVFVLVLYSLVFFVSCNRDVESILENIVQDSEIVLSEEGDFELQVDSIKEISLSGGNETDYGVAETTPNVVEAKINEKILTIKGISAGRTTLTISSGTHAKSINIIVTENKTTVLVTSIKLGEQTHFQIGRNYQISAEVLPHNATNKELLWESSHPDVVKIVNKTTGEIFVRNKPGHKATITAIAKDGSGVKAQITVTATQMVTNIKINLADTLLQVGAKLTVRAHVTPDNATEKDVYWSSSHPAVATIDQDGNITALSEGKTTITASSKDGSGVSDSVELRIIDSPVNKIVLDQASQNTLKVAKNSKTNLSISTYYDSKKIETIINGKPKSPYAKLYFYIKNGTPYNTIADVKDGVLNTYSVKGTFDLEIIYNHEFENEVIIETVRVTIE